MVARWGDSWKRLVAYHPMACALFRNCRTSSAVFQEARGLHAIWVEVIRGVELKLPSHSYIIGCVALMGAPKANGLPRDTSCEVLCDVRERRLLVVFLSQDLAGVSGLLH